MSAFAMDVSPVHSIASGPSDFTRSMEKYFLEDFDITKCSTHRAVKNPTVEEYDDSLDRLDFEKEASSGNFRYQIELSSGNLQRQTKSSSGGLQTHKISTGGPQRNTSHQQSRQQPTLIPAGVRHSRAQVDYSPRREPTAIAKLRALVGANQHLLRSPSPQSFEAFNPSLTGLGSSRRAPSEKSGTDPTPEQTFGESLSGSQDSSLATKATVIRHSNRSSTPVYLKHTATQVTLTSIDMPEPTMLPYTQSILDQVQNLQTEIESYKGELDTLKSENNGLQAKVRTQQQHLKSIKQQNMDFKTENRDLTTENLSLKVENKTRQEQLEGVKAKNKNLKMACKDLHRENVSLKTEHKGLYEEIKGLRNELEDFQTRFTKLQHERNRMGEALMYEWGKHEVGLIKKRDGTMGMGYRYKFSHKELDRREGDMTILD